MFNKKNKEAKTKEESEYPELFKVILEDCKNESIVSKIDFYPLDDEWYTLIHEVKEKDIKRMIKSMEKLPNFNEDDVKKVGTHVSGEVIIKDIAFEIDFSKDYIYLNFVDEQKEIFYEVTKFWIELESIQAVYGFVREEMTVFYKEHRS